MASLARPGGNVTGVSADASPQTYGKILELMKEALPNASRVAVLLNPNYPWQPMRKATGDAARTLGLSLTFTDVRAPNDVDYAFSAIRREHADALFVWEDPVSLLAEFVEAGGLLAYSPSLRSLARRGAYYIDKILKGARPADLPIEEPTKLNLVINLKTARTLGLTISPPLLLRADHVIQ